MAAKPKLTKRSFTAVLNTNKQNAESVRRIVDRVLGMAGCRGCGQIAVLRVDMGYPPPEINPEGVVFEQLGH